MPHMPVSQTIRTPVCLQLCQVCVCIGTIVDGEHAHLAHGRRWIAAAGRGRPHGAAGGYGCAAMGNPTEAVLRPAVQYVHMALQPRAPPAPGHDQALGVSAGSGMMPARPLGFAMGLASAELRLSWAVCG